jgi:RNA polymerase sigma-70 factor (ECF subfamily)
MSSATAPNPRNQVTRLLVEWGNGNKAALDLLMPIVYDELHKLAASYLRREHNARTLQPTAIIHEAYMRLVEQDLSDLNSRSHFFGVAAHLMRQILIDHARKHQTAKRGAGSEKLPLDEATYFAPERSSELIGLDDALKSLEKTDPRKAKVIELRFFGGLSIEETAEVLGISVATVGREQRFAEAWLHTEMASSDE